MSATAGIKVAFTEGPLKGQTHLVMSSEVHVPVIFLNGHICDGIYEVDFTLDRSEPTARFVGCVCGDEPRKG